MSRDENENGLAQAYALGLENDAHVDLDDGLRRIITNAYAAGYRRGTIDALRGCVEKIEILAPTPRASF